MGRAFRYVVMAAAAGLAALVGLPACNLLGSSESVAGNWTWSGRGRVIQLSLRQDDDRISGTACAVSDAVLLYRNAPVTGTHPDLEVLITMESVGTCCAHMAGARLRFRLEKRGDIVSDQGGFERFKRGSAGDCSEVHIWRE